MNTSKYLLTLLLFIVIGIFIGSIFLKFNQSNVNTDLISHTVTLTSGEHMQISHTTSGDSSITHPEEEISENKPNPEHIKAVYLTGWTTGSKSKRENIIRDLNNYGFNAVVIDIKDEAGNVTYPSNVQTAIDISASSKMITDIQEAINDFHNSNIYVIGRIVTFKDPIYAKNMQKFTEYFAM